MTGHRMYNVAKVGFVKLISSKIYSAASGSSYSLRLINRYPVDNVNAGK